LARPLSFSIALIVLDRKLRHLIQAPLSKHRHQPGPKVASLGNQVLAAVRLQLAQIIFCCVGKGPMELATSGKVKTPVPGSARCLRRTVL
jgi:hypothetical protein